MTQLVSRLRNRIHCGSDNSIFGSESQIGASNRVIVEPTSNFIKVKIMADDI